MLAIIIPYFKITFFESTLQSLANQTDKRFKVYIGDDASAENPSQLLEKYKTNFICKSHRFSENLGGISLVKQWERCIDLIGDEEWLMILGDDDVLSDNFVEEFHKNVKNVLLNHISVVRFASQKIDYNGTIISELYTHPILEKSSDFLFRKSRSSLSEYVFNKSTVKSVGFKNLPLAWFTDVLAVLEFSEFSNVYSINSSFVNVRISDESISGSINNSHLKSKAAIIFYYFLLNRKSHFFSVKQNDQLWKSLSKCYINDKKNVGLLLKISALHFKKFKLKQYGYFLLNIFDNFQIKYNASRLQSK